MKLQVQRLHYTDLSTIGEMSIDGIFECFTLEPRKDQSQGKPYAIPAGTYQIVLQLSHRFKMTTPHLLSVPGFELIEIHPGNRPEDTEGCTLVGKYYDEKLPNWISQSRDAFEALMQKLTTAADITYIG